MWLGSFHLHERAGVSLAPGYIHGYKEQHFRTQESKGYDIIQNFVNKLKYLIGGLRNSKEAKVK